MSTQNKVNTPVKGQPSNAPNKGNGAVEQHTDRSSKKEGEAEEKRKGDLEPMATGKDRNTAKPTTAREGDAKSTTITGTKKS